MATTPSPYSPDVQAWLAGLAPMPFGAPPVPLYPGSFGSEDELEILNDILTAQNKGNDVMSDPAQIAQYGTGPGGFGPEAFQPSVTFEPVKAPGYMQMQRYLQSNDPVTQFIAKRLDEGATAMQAEVELRALVDNKGPGWEQINAALPKTAPDSPNPGQPDWGRIASVASSLEKAIIEDPQFNALDERTGLPANRVEEESEAARYFRESGLPSPYETYSPDLLADPNVLAQERQLADVGQPRAMREWVSAQDKYAMLNNLINQISGSPYGDATAAGEEGDPRPYSIIDELPSSGLSVAQTQQESDYNTARDNKSPRTLYEPGIKTTTGRRTPSQAKVGERSRNYNQRRQAGRNMLDAEAEKTRMNNAFQDDEYARLERQAMMRRMTQAGYTPFNEVMRARQQTIYGR